MFKNKVGDALGHYIYSSKKYKKIFINYNYEYNISTLLHEFTHYLDHEKFNINTAHILPVNYLKNENNDSNKVKLVNSKLSHILYTLFSNTEFNAFTITTAGPDEYDILSIKNELINYIDTKSTMDLLRTELSKIYNITNLNNTLLVKFFIKKLDLKYNKFNDKKTLTLIKLYNKLTNIQKKYSLTNLNVKLVLITADNILGLNTLPLENFKIDKNDINECFSFFIYYVNTIKARGKFEGLIVLIYEKRKNLVIKILLNIINDKKQDESVIKYLITKSLELPTKSSLFEHITYIYNNCKANRFSGIDRINSHISYIDINNYCYKYIFNILLCGKKVKDKDAGNGDNDTFNTLLCNFYDYNYNEDKKMFVNKLNLIHIQFDLEYINDSKFACKSIFSKNDSEVELNYSIFNNRGDIYISSYPYIVRTSVLLYNLADQETRNYWKTLNNTLIPELLINLCKSNQKFIECTPDDIMDCLPDKLTIGKKLYIKTNEHAYKIIEMVSK